MLAVGIGDAVLAQEGSPRAIEERRLLIATDAWAPQINGVVRTLDRLVEDLRRRGVDVALVTPQDFPTVPCPGYPEIRLAMPGARELRKRVERFRPDLVHIATEGPIGWRMRALARSSKLPFTTSFHTKFAEYVHRRAAVPEKMTYGLLRRFHNAGSACLVPTEAVLSDLEERGFRNLVTWSRGVDRTLFQPREPFDLGIKPPIFLTVSRVAPEKNLEAFLDLSLPGSKVVVGDGPLLPAMRRRYPDVLFTGFQTGEALVRHYSTADVFVFPSRTDTFGLVLLEAMACGVPVAAFPEPGPVKVIAGSGAGVVSNDLRVAAIQALLLSRSAPLERAALFDWERGADIFLATMEHAIRVNGLA